MGWFFPTERERWATPAAQIYTRPSIGLPALDAQSREVYGRVLPRGVPIPRFYPDQPPINSWMPPYDLLQHAWRPGQLIVGKLAGRYLGHLDDRPMVTIAGARAGKTSTVLEPNLYLYPGSMLVLDPKGELASRTAPIRRALGHNVYVLDPFGQSGEPSASFNPLAELDPDDETIVDDVMSVTPTLVIDEGDARARHWNDGARMLLTGVSLLVLTFAENERNLVTVRQLLTLTHPRLRTIVKNSMRLAGDAEKDTEYFNENRLAVQTLLQAMANRGERFGGILAGIGNRFLNMAHLERGGIFSTASTQTDFLDSLPLRKILRHSDFRLSSLRSDRPTTIYLCLPVGRPQHHRWLRMVVQIACIVLEQMGTYPRDRAPILFMLEEAAVLGHLDILERAAAYFPGFGVKLWAILQNITQLQDNYPKTWETFVGNAGLVQCFANGDPSTLHYIAQRLANLIAPFELQTAFSRRRGTQLLMMEGEPPAAAMRLEHHDVAFIREQMVSMARELRAAPRGRPALQL